MASASSENRLANDYVGSEVGRSKVYFVNIASIWTALLLATHQISDTISL